MRVGDYAEQFTTERARRAVKELTAVVPLNGLEQEELLRLAASIGILPPILAAAAQSLPDIGILANSSRLLRWEPRR